MTEEREAGARIKINKLLEASGWRFEDGPEGTANIELEAGVKFSELGDDLENAVSRKYFRFLKHFLASKFNENEPISIYKQLQIPQSPFSSGCSVITLN